MGLRGSFRLARELRKGTLDDPGNKVSVQTLMVAAWTLNRRINNL
jgi:hypothetical protein